MPNYSQVFYVLHIALIEIRATENIEKAQTFADVVHNIPTMVGSGRPEPEIIAKVMINAKRQGVEGYFSKLFEKAKDR